MKKISKFQQHNAKEYNNMKPNISKVKNNSNLPGIKIK